MHKSSLEIITVNVKLVPVFHGDVIAASVVSAGFFSIYLWEVDRWDVDNLLPKP